MTLKPLIRNLAIQPVTDWQTTITGPKDNPYEGNMPF
jgi:ubiquitin-protein ligase